METQQNREPRTTALPPAATPGLAPIRQPYQPPRLTRLGGLAELTAGPNPAGAGDLFAGGSGIV